MAEPRITVDVRERWLREASSEAADDASLQGVTFAALEVGDFRIEAGGRTVIIERKTLPDLAASIKDGRYREQKARLLAACEAAHALAVYAIEGTGLSWRTAEGSHINGLPSTALQTILHQLAVDRRGVRLVRTSDAGDTWAYVRGLCDRLHSGKVCLATEEAGSPAEGLPGGHGGGGYASVVKVKKSDNLTCPKTVATMQLSVIPHVSARIATALLDDTGCGTMAALCAFLQGLGGRPQALARLAGVPLSSAARPRRLGEGLARRVLGALLGEAVEPIEAVESPT